MKLFLAALAAFAVGSATLLSAVPAGAQPLVRSAPAVVSVAGGFTSLVPSRLLDTRSGVGAPKVAVAPGATVALQVAGRGGVPASGVSAIVLNVTVVAPVSAGFVTVFGAGTTRPTVSNLNFVKAQTVPNLVVAPVGANGKVALYNGSSGSVQLLADVSGYYRSGTPTVSGAFGSLVPSRLLDTRSGVGAPKVAVAPGATVALQVAGRAGVPASGVSAVVLNVTVTQPAAAGYLTVFGGGASRPTVSNLNFVKAQTVPNLVVAPVGSNGKVSLYNGSSGSVQLLADVSGYYRSGAPSAEGAFGALPASRLLDTRSGVGAPKVAVAPGATVALQVAGRAGVPASGVSAVVLNVTVTQPAAAGYLTVFGGGASRPTVSNLNFVKAQTVPNLVVAPVGSNGKVSLYNGSSGSVHLIADVSGYYRATAATPPGPVTGLTAAAATTSITLRWVNPTGSSLTGVLIRRSVGSQLPASPTSGSFVADVTKPTVVFTNTGLDQGTKYSYALFAHDGGPVYAARATVSATTTTAPQDPVTGVAATAASTSVTLRWVNPSSSSSTGVMIRRTVGSVAPGTPSAGTLVADVAKPTAGYTDTGLASGTQYSYALFAHDATPTYAVAASVTTRTIPPPGPVTGVTASATNTSITLSWVNPGSSSLTGVMIRRAPGSVAPTTPSAGTLVADVAKPTADYTNGGLKPNTQYSYALFAHDATPTYAAAAAVTSTTTDVAVVSISGTVTDAGGTHHGLDLVEVDVISTGSAGGFSTSTVADGTWSVTGLPAGTYSVCFDARDAEGGSSDTAGYVNQCYKNKPTVQTANPVTVTAGATTVDVDAALVGKVSASGFLPPRASGPSVSPVAQLWWPVCAASSATSVISVQPTSWSPACADWSTAATTPRASQSLSTGTSTSAVRPARSATSISR